MKVRLVHPDRDVDCDAALSDEADVVEQDLEVATLLDAMALGDPFLRGVARHVLLSQLWEPEAIRYRQAILADARGHAPVVRELYACAVRGVETKRDSRFFWFRDSPDSVRQKSLGMLATLFGILRDVRRVVERDADGFTSDGFRRLFAMLRRDLDDEYLDTVAIQLNELGFRRGALLSAAVGRGNRGSGYMLRRPKQQRLLERLTPGAAGLSFTVADRDESGMDTLAEIRGRGSARVADALGQSTDHVLAFFGVLRAELGFYVACLNLSDELAARGVATTMPDVRPAAEATLAARELRDAALAFHLPEPPVTNDLDADGTRLVLVTGPNQGGKSTFLRSVGLAQLMMQSGMFVCADAYRASVSTGICTHFKREEDPTMTHGKLEEELERMRHIADRIRPGGLLLCNESFAATNEREGSEIAHGVLRAMIEADVRVVFVTHLYDLAERLRGDTLDRTLYLRAERTQDGQRTFRIVPGEPQPTSHAYDSYRRIFGVTDPMGSER
jgi:DNA mismatch repair ATPase MutS